MAGLLSTQNWRNLLFGFRPKGAQKGGVAGAPPGLYDGDGGPNLQYWDMSNRVKALCKYYD